MRENNLYEIFPVEDDENHRFFCLLEKSTNHAYDFFLFEDDAVEQKKFLEQGNGFAGHTPKFMLNKVKVTNNINDEFSKLLEENNP